MKKMTKRVILCLLLGLTVLVSAAQQKRISGTVKDDKGNPVPGATYMVKGTNIAGATDENGNFSVTVDDTNAVLVFSSVNFTSREITVGQGNALNVVLMPSTGSLGEVVVTALGVRRAKKSLGYAVQQVNGSTLAATKESNLVNALTGKVAGLQIVRSSNGPAGSSKIVLRGYNSLTGNNQPLIVVDGVPMENFTGATNNDMWNPSFDMGNGLADISSEDIESISVLKGPSAAALYGSRAGNGVILITTKTGRKQAGLGITVNSSVGIESIFTRPELQSEFGQGTNGVYDNRSNLSWGPKIAGQQVDNWDGKKVSMAAYDNLDNYFDNGVVQNHGITFQEQFRSTSLYTSFNYLDDKSMLPGIKLTRTNLMARAVSKFGNGEKWTTDTKIQYSNTNAKNRPMGGIRPENGFFTMYQLPRSMDITGFSQGADEFGNMIWYGGSSQVNPYWSNKYNLNQDVRDRFILNGSLKYDFTTWLNAEIRGGADFYTTNMESKLFGGSPLTPTGRYSMGKHTFMETNYSTLISAKKDNLVGKLGGNASLGGNLMSREFSSLAGSSGQLVVPNLFSLNNGVDRATVDEGFNEQKINSVYGTVGVNWDGYFFVDATFRNDWSSTLIKENQSY
ncbi:MAG TPA: TonB-dependent receptor plug domain-containing protein, partial [Chitinophagaceae bacterium]